MVKLMNCNLNFRYGTQRVKKNLNLLPPRHIKVKNKEKRFLYLIDAKVIILVFDITERKSFNNLKDWLISIRESAPENVG